MTENTIASPHNEQRIFKPGSAFVRASPAFWFTTAGSRETERLVIQSSAPHRPLSISDTGPLAAQPDCGEINWHGSGLGGAHHQTWTIRSRCAGGSCRLTLSTPGHRTPVALRNTGVDGYVATTPIRGLRCTAGRQAVSPTLSTSVLSAGPHRISAHSTFGVSQCGGAAGVGLALRGSD